MDEIDEVDERLGDLYSMTAKEYGELGRWLATWITCVILIAAASAILVFVLT